MKLCLSLLILVVCTELAQQQTPPSTGLYFMLGAKIYRPGDSVVITNIGEQEASNRSNPGSTLVCVTTNVNTACCRGNDNPNNQNPNGGAVGEWFYPDGSMVPRPNNVGSAMNVFARYGYTHHVRLSSVGSPTGPLGVYRCDVPDGTTGSNVSASINIIAPPPAVSTTPVAVSTPAAVSSTAAPPEVSTTPPMIMPSSTDPTMIATSVMEDVVATSTVAEVDASETVIDTVVSTTTLTPTPTPTPPPPTPNVTITPSNITAMVGSEFSLDCSSDTTGTFIWRQSSGSGALMSGSGGVTITTSASNSSSVLTISSVMTSHAGTYTCVVSAGGVSQTESSDVVVQLNPPSSVMVVSPVTLVGSPLTLTCSIMLAAMLETAVQVEVVWTGPDGSTVSGGTVPSGSSTLYTSELTLNSLSASDAGTSYTCTASLNTSTLPSVIPSSNISDSSPISLQIEAPTSVMVSSSKNGSSMDLTCSITLARAVPTDVTVEVMWTGPDGSSLSDGTTPTGTNISYSSTLSLSSVSVSDAGTYNCTATLTSASLYLISSTSVAGYTEVTVQIGAPTSVVAPPSSSLSTGDPLSLTCSIMLASEVVSGTSLEVVWTLPDGSSIMANSSGISITLTGTGTSYNSTLSITSLTASSAGTYTCSAALSSTIPFVASSVSTNGSNSLIIQVRAPSSANVSTSPAAIFAGMSFTLTCSIELSEEVASGVSLQVLWTGPGGSTPTGTLAGSGTSYTSTISGTAVVMSGDNYTCSASLVSSVSFLTSSTTSTDTITVGVVPVPSAPTIISTIPSSNSISLTWTQSDGDVVESYSISYSFTVTDCTGVAGAIGSEIVTGINGSEITYCLTNLEENTEYIISISAVNGAGTSAMSPMTTTNTPVTAPVAPTLRVTSTASTSINIAWDEIPCLERNGRITRYVVSYCLAPVSSCTSLIPVTDVMIIVLTITNLIPRTSYNIAIRADSEDAGLNTYTGQYSSPLTVETAVPQTLGFFLKGMLYSRNVAVDLTEVGANSDALICLTTLMECCRGIDTNGSGAMGDWRFPGGSAVPSQSGGASLSRNRGPSSVLLHRINSAMSPTGVYTCEIPDANNPNTELNIYLYVGQLPVLSTTLEYSRDSSQLTCTSSGGLVTSVRWSVDNANITTDSPLFSQTITLVDRLTATYQLVLSGDISNFVGTFSCAVIDGDGRSSSASQTINGVTVRSSPNVPLRVGENSTLTCTNDVGVAELVEWRSSDGTVLARVASTNMSELLLSPVNDSLSVHGADFTCHVTRNSTIFTQNLAVTVIVPSPTIAVNISSSGNLVAGSEYNLTCVVYELFTGLTGSPAATWTTADNAPLPGTVFTSSTNYGTVAVLSINPLRTSYPTSYTCHGSYISPAENMTRTIEETENILIQISTPNVSVSVSSGPLVAGGVDNVIVTCSATVDTTVVDFGTLIYSITWLNRQGDEISSNSRTNIVSSTSSSSSTSTLTLSPLSIEDTNFACDVVVSDMLNRLAPSAEGTGATTVDVQVPDPPRITVDASGTSIAGETYSLTCTVSLEQELRESPVIEWIGPDGGVIENGTPVDVSLNSSSTTMTLLFSPLHTSHGGTYWCRATVTDTAAKIVIMNSSSVNVTVQIPPPIVTITGSPIDEGFHIGLFLLFTGRAVFNPAVDTPEALDALSFWTSPSNSNTTVAEEEATSPSIQYITTLSVDLQSASVDSGFYNVTFNISSAEPFIAGVGVTEFRNIIVEPFPPQMVQIFSESTVIPDAGSNHTVQCIARRRDTLSSFTLLEIIWLDNNNDVITPNSDTNITGVTSSTDTNITSTLTFPNIRTSQAGRYTCAVNMTIPDVVEDHPVMKTIDVYVRISVATSVNLTANRTGLLYWGTSLLFTCIVNYDMEVVDTPVTFSINITGPVTNTISNEIETNMFNATYDPLLPKHNGSYECLSSIMPSSQTPFVNTVVNDASKPFILQLTELPPPVVSVSSPPVTEAGQSLTLTCNVTVVEYLIVDPQVEWIQRDGSTISGVSVNPSTGEGPVVTGTLSTRDVNFAPLRTSHAGQYTCWASVNIVDIPRLFNSSIDTTVVVQIPTLMITIPNVGDVIHGTVASIQATAEVDKSIVDTPIQFMGRWGRQDKTALNTEVTNVSNTDMQVSPYSSTLTFAPLNNNSVDGGVYVFTATVGPLNSNNVIQSTDTQSTTLTVEPYPRLNITKNIATAECQPNAGATLSGTISLLSNTYSDRNVTYTWRRGGEIESTSSSADLPNVSLNLQSLTVDTMGLYDLEVCLDVSRSGLLNHCSSATYEIVVTKPEVVENLQCSAIADILSITWVAPKNGAVSYRVTVLKYVQAMGTNMVTTTDLNPPFVREVTDLEVPTPALQMVVPYSVIVMSLNSARCGEVRDITCFTKEGVPTKSPENVKVAHDPNDATVLLVTWDPLTIVEAQGFITYAVVATPPTGSRKRQNGAVMQTVPGNASGAMLTGANPGLAYDVSVTPVTRSGEAGPGTNTRFTPVPTDDGGNVAVIIAVIVVVLVLIIIIVAVVLIAFLFYRKLNTPKKGLYSPGHYTATPVANPYDSMELKYKDLTENNDTSKEMEANLSTEVVPEQEPVPVPVAVAPVEVMDRMKPVSLESFRDHVVSKHNERDKGFESEYQSFGSDPLSPHTVAKLPHNRVKNRFANIFPYDLSRVILPAIPGVEGSEYINACTIDGYNRSGCYIAAQGPMPNTEEDFWRMIWEMKISNIVMLTKCLEAGRRKCEQYWAENMGEVYHTPDKMFSVTTTSLMPFADFVIRTFSVKHRDVPDTELKVSQHHFTSWPDHGVPKFATSLLSFIRRVQKEHNKDVGVPLLVHCSAGVGRTGTFITLDAMLERIKSEQSVNVYEFVKNMRKRRVLMVQTMAQYVFIHDALNEFITCGDTEIKASSLRAKVNYLSKVIPGKGITGFNHQFQLLEQVSRVPLEEDCSDAAEHYNRDKNRYPDKPPYNLSRARLRPSGEEGSEYINGSFIDGYKQRNAYIATQGPLPNTVDDLWRMMWEFKSKTLVTLCQPLEQGVEVCHQFWPSTENDPQTYGKITVTLQSSTNYDHYEVRKFQLQDEKVAGASPRSEGNFVVTQFHHLDWPEDSNPSSGTLIEMLDMITKMQMSTGNRPITVMCNDGVGRSGTFLCIHSQLERLKAEGVVDVFQAVKSSRIQRGYLMPEAHQFAYTHQVLADYMDKFDNYANFKDMI